MTKSVRNIIIQNIRFNDHEIRTTQYNGKPLYNTKDLATALGLSEEAKEKYFYGSAFCSNVTAIRRAAEINRELSSVLKSTCRDRSIGVIKPDGYNEDWIKDKN